MSTFRALVNIPKSQLRGTDNPRKARQEDREARLAKLACPEPLWKTEAEVVRALLSGALAAANIPFDKAIADVKAWERYQKALNAAQHFTPRKAQPNHKRYNHTMQFSR